nr:hypothetical protein [uncultured Flavobacterium sp.]
MRKLLAIGVLLFAFSGFAQNVSDYKYIVVPAKFSIFKEANKYNMNSLTKSVFEKQGYEVYYENEVLPQELAENRCKALYADMLENNNVFVTKIKIELKDCKNQVVYVSAEGTSREKEYVKAYIQAFREVGKSIEILRSKPQEMVIRDTTAPKTEIVHETNSNLLFAQPIANGFQLVDNTPKVVMKLLKSSMTNCYIGQKENVQGLVFNRNNQWFFEYYQNDKLISEKIEIKF